LSSDLSIVTVFISLQAVCCGSGAFLPGIRNKFFPDPESNPYF
jgi:hypothetical protein